jgi:DNA-binding NtrC family response regulator
VKQVLLVEDSDDLRDSFADLLRLGGATCLAAGSLADVEARAAEVLASDLAIIDINLGPNTPSGIVVHRWLRERQFRGRIVFLTGHGRAHPLVQEALRIDGVQVYEKPLGTDAILQLVQGKAS